MVAPEGSIEGIARRSWEEGEGKVMDDRRCCISAASLSAIAVADTNTGGMVLGITRQLSQLDNNVGRIAVIVKYCDWIENLLLSRGHCQTTCY